MISQLARRRRTAAAQPIVHYQSSWLLVACRWLLVAGSLAACRWLPVAGWLLPVLAALPFLVWVRRAAARAARRPPIVHYQSSWLLVAGCLSSLAAGRWLPFHSGSGPRRPLALLCAAGCRAPRFA